MTGMLTEEDQAVAEVMYNVISDAERSQQVSGLYGGGYSHNKMPGRGQEIDQSNSPQSYGGQMTRAQLEGEYGQDKYLQSTFGSFDNYMAYMGEANEMLGAQNWWEAKGIDKRTAAERVSDYEGRGDLAYNGNQSQVNDNRQSDANARQSGYNSWLSSDENQALMNNYGIQQKITDDNGDIYEWSGNNYIRTYVAERMGVEDVAKAAIIATAAGGLATGFAPLVGGSLGVTSGAGLGAIKGGLGAAAGGALTGNIDPKSIAVGALMGGLNPGGMLSDKLGAVPESFAGGFISGGVNDLVGTALMTGDVDLQDSLVAGLQAGGVNSLMNGVKAINENTPEAIMNKLANQHRADYIAIHGSAEGYEGLTDVQLNQVAMAQPLVNKTNLGALIGEGGLLPFVPELDISGLATLKDNILGYSPGTQLFTGPNGEELTNAELIQQGYDPQDVYGATMQGVDVDGYKYVLPTNQQDGLLTQITDYLGDTKVGEAVGTALDVAANAQFKDKYGFLPQDNPQLAQQIVAYGDLVENYSYADNPRGDSEMYGSTFWLPDEYTKGYTTEQTPSQLNQDGTGWVGGTRSAINVSQETIDQINELGDAQREEILNSPYIINLLNQSGGVDTTGIDTATTGSANPNTVLPGAENNAFIDALTNALSNATDDTGSTQVETGGSEVTTNTPSGNNVNTGRIDQIAGLLSSASNSASATNSQAAQGATGRADQISGLLSYASGAASAANNQIGSNTTDNTEQVVSGSESNTDSDRALRNGEEDTTSEVIGSYEELKKNDDDELKKKKTDDDELKKKKTDDDELKKKKTDDDKLKKTDDDELKKTDDDELVDDDNGGGVLGGLLLSGGGGDKPYWTPLNPYSKVSRWRKARDRVYDNIDGLLTATGKAPDLAMSKKQMTEEGLLS